jgi:hypothetical protein
VEPAGREPQNVVGVAPCATDGSSGVAVIAPTADTQLDRDAPSCCGQRCGQTGAGSVGSAVANQDQFASWSAAAEGAVSDGARPGSPSGR